MPKFFRGDGWLRLKQAGPAGHEDGLLCHVRGADTVRKKGTAVVFVSLRGLRVSRLPWTRKS